MSTYCGDEDNFAKLKVAARFACSGCHRVLGHDWLCI